MRGVPPGRLVVYFGLLCLLPLLFVGFFLVDECSKQRGARLEMGAIEHRLIAQRHRGMRNASTRERFSGADPMYLNQVLEPYSLLERERAALEELVEHEPSLPNKEVLQRYEFLSSGRNALSFAEGVVQSAGDLRETVESLTHPVEIDGEDLNELLLLLEGDTSPGRPQLLVTEFRLERKELASLNEVFVLDVKLLKREYADR